MPCEPKAELQQVCFMVHGRLYLSNGIPFRLWPVGTKRYFSITNESFHPLIERYLDFHSKIYGDFLVCPQSEERSGWMRSVCIGSAEHLVVERWNDDFTKPKVFRIQKSWE
jgi:hypothetical protein